MADGVGKGALVGGFKGATTGAKLGSFLPGPGNLIGAGIGAIGGAITGGVKANKANKERERGLQLPEGQDPTQISRLLEIDRIAKNIQSGTDAATQTALNQGAATTAQTQNRLARVTGGNIGATTDALLKAQRAGGEAANQSIAQGQSRLPFFMNLGQQLANRQEQRRLELELLGRAQTSAETAQREKERNVNSNALLASGLLGSNLQDAQGRIQSLINQGIGKLGGDMEGLGATEMSTIDTGLGGPIELPANLGGMGGIGGGEGFQIPEMNLGVFAGAGGATGG